MASTAPTHTYRCYGLTLVSDIELPELTPAELRSVESADVRIVSGCVAPGGLVSGQQIGPYLWVTPRQLWLQVPGVARFQIEGGDRITVEGEPGVDGDSIRVFLLGSAFGALLFQRGYLVLHGNAIRVGDQCLITVGRSGAGKSTLAAGFLQRGYSLLADDVVPIDAHCRAVPGFPRIKLWQDTADKLGIDTAPLRRIRPHLEKYSLPLREHFAGEPLPVRWVYLLGTHSEPDFRFEPIQGLQRFQPLRANTYRVRFLEGMALKAEHLQLCGQLAGRIRLVQVTRPEQGFALDELIDRLLGDAAAHP